MKEIFLTILSAVLLLNSTQKIKKKRIGQG